MSIQPGAMLYTQAFGSRPENVEVPHVDTRAPSSSDNNFPIGKRWVYQNVASYELIGITTSNGITTANWNLLASDSGPLDTLTGGSGGAISPSAGNITLAGTGSQIATAGSGSTITFSLVGPYSPASYTAHGVLIGEGSSSVVATTPGTNGQLLIGSTGADPAFSTLTSTGGTLTVTGGAHTLNIDLAAPVTVPNGGTGATTLTGVLTGNGTSAVTGNAVTQHGVIIGGASNAVGSTAVGATGTLLAGATGADPSFTASPSVTGSLTAGTTLTATLGNITATNGNLVLGTAGNKQVYTSVGTTTAAGANSAGTVALVGGTATVATTAVTASSLVRLTCQALGTVTAPSALACTTKTAGTSFVILASQATDTSTIFWEIVN
jgi:collagen type VII alpha